ncbi:MAG: WS/DGAT domain-containing protein [Candidatus Nanopelagicales bacterium]|jgi:diacylglycerol O-acyltransferase|nr:WS/DGAT domain-containing protein [Candidatus Nanopelagicales bacterium]MCU0297577.1 WS/DGAT domain-containing protein [Candidatus Nanopelagicales bacterium]
MTDAPISVQDALWLNMDRPNNLMIIDSILWFRQTPDWDAVVEVIDERMVSRFPVFSAKAVRRKDGYVWKQDAAFDIENHIIRPDLPEPRTLDSVQQYVADQRSKPLTKSKPLWQFHFIDGVVDSDGADLGACILGRIHHSIADGVRLTQVIFGLCDPIDGETAVAATVGQGRKADPDRKPASGLDRTRSAVTAAGQRAAQTSRDTADAVRANLEAATEASKQAAAGVVAAAGDPVGTAKAVPGAIVAAPGQLRDAATSTFVRGQAMFDDALDIVGDPGKLLDAFSAYAPVPEEATNTMASVAKLGLSGPSVRTVWSGTPGIEKTAHWVDAFSLDKVKEIGRRSKTTVNDVLLTIVAGTLMRYLEEHEEAVDQVMWMIPVSLKPFDAKMPEELGNHFALIAFEMPLNFEDPKARLHEVNRRINRIKNSREAVITFGVQRVVSESPERLSVFLTNFFANKAVGILTNVPGPRSQIALAGTPVEAMLGWAPSSGDQPMTICMFTYNGRVHVGFGTDEKLIPDSERLPDLFGQEARALYRSVTGRDPGL